MPYSLPRLSVHMRTNNIRLSDTEKKRLAEYRDTHYHPTVPFGYVVAELIKKAEGDE